MHRLDAWRLAVDLGLVVLIWLVQLVVYPSFAHIDAGSFQAWHQRYQSLITVVVIPLMLGQVVVLALQWRQGADVWLVVATVLVVGIWLVTFAASVPAHAALQADGNTPARVGRLVATNWLRTAAWSAVLLTGILRRT